MDEPAICLRLVKEAVPDEDGEIRVQFFEVDLVDIGCDRRLEGLFVLPSQLFGMHGGVSAGDLGGVRPVGKDAEDVPGAVGLAKERVDGGRHRRSLPWD